MDDDDDDDDSPNDVNDEAQRRTERMKSDVSDKNEARNAARNEYSDWMDSVVHPKNQEKSLPVSFDRQENDAKFLDRNSSNEKDAQHSPKREDDNIVPEISQDDDKNKNLSPRGGKYNLRTNPNPNYSKDFKY